MKQNTINDLMRYDDVAAKVWDILIEGICEENSNTKPSDDCRKLREVLAEYTCHDGMYRNEIDYLFRLLLGATFGSAVDYALKTMQEHKEVLYDESDGGIRVDGGILNEDGNTFACNGKTVTFEHCEKNCPKQPGCDTYCWASEDAVIRNGGA